MKSAIRALQITHEELERSLVGRGPASPGALLTRISIHEVETAIQVLTKHDEEQQAAQEKEPAQENAFEAAFGAWDAEKEPPEEEQAEARLLEARSVAEAIQVGKESSGSGPARVPCLRRDDGAWELPPPERPEQA